MKLNKYLTEYDDFPEATDTEKKYLIKKLIDDELDEMFEKIHRIVHPTGSIAMDKALMKYAIEYLKKEASGKIPRW